MITCIFVWLRLQLKTHHALKIAAARSHKNDLNPSLFQFGQILPRDSAVGDQTMNGRRRRD